MLGATCGHAVSYITTLGLTIYTGAILPLLQYGAPVWINAKITLPTKLS